MNYKDYFKNGLYESLDLSEELRRFRTPADVAKFRREKGLPEPTRREMLGGISTDRENRRRNPNSISMDPYSSDDVEEVNPDMDRLSPRDPRRPENLGSLSASRSADPENGRARYRTQRLLDAVHYFSNVHNFQLKPEHIEGIDFSMGDPETHIDAIFNKLRQSADLPPRLELMDPRPPRHTR